MRGFTLLELLIGVALFSMVLTAVVLGLQTSERTITASNRVIPVEAALQNAMDASTRLIRESENVTGGGDSLTLTQWDGSVKTLNFSAGTLFYGTSIIQGGLDGAQFTVRQGEVVKEVILTFYAGFKTVASSASLRNVPAGSTGSVSQNPIQVSSSSPAPSNPSLPLPGPKGPICGPLNKGNSLTLSLPCP